ncbi:hypothetical protein PYW07_010450 [Mythimna separata]|uniref:EFHB C-terminal EF-hand domain-containing protein n=1 Tax=Mythimna separata TaxID=271217 RepID=A0AAD7YAM3_MYTSE|nr:hypothetical protein PYW07_010450 [Mythimna separata]
MLTCNLKTQGGKGNEGMFIERGSRAIFAAGKPTEQPNVHVAEHLKHYLLQEEVDALISDAIKPEPKKIYYKFRRSGNAGELINPPMKTKFETLVNEIKESCYSSYWKKLLGTTRDQTPLLPAGFDVRNAIFGRKTVYVDNAYDLIMPKDTPIDKTPPSLAPGYQTDRNYCKPAYDPNKNFGITYRPDKRGTYAKCCVTEDRVLLSTAFYSPRAVLETDFKIRSDIPMGHSSTPNDNIKCVPKGFAFGKLIPSTGNVSNCLSTCPINSGREFFLICLAHLNTLRRCLSKLVDDPFFRKFYMHLKYLDQTNTGWLPKDVVYNFCSIKNVRVHPTVIEPLLEMWNGFDGSQIEYKIFVDIINFRKPLPDIPKIPNVGAECLEYSTTYNDMVKPGQEIGQRRMAGLPSGRYFDKDEFVPPAGMCKADSICLPEESDVRACISPSNFTLFGISHRDMYAKRSPDVVRRVFEAAGEKFTDETFNELWDEAKKYHSQGWVCYATFRKVLDEKATS